MGDAYPTNSFFLILKKNDSVKQIRWKKETFRLMAPKYEKSDPITHILHRPDMYVGALQPREQKCWVANTLQEGEIHLQEKTLVVSEAFVRVFVEALSNAIDNVWRSREAGIPATRIKLTVDESTGKTSIWNDGLHIPIEIHETEKIYNPELIFGHLLTGSNLNDKEKRLSSGRNGLGVKLLNVYSRTFTVECCDPDHKKMYRQKWKDNMRVCQPAQVRDFSSEGKKGYTEVSWIPDFERFGMTGYQEDVLSVLKKYAVDAAMVCNIPVYWNKEKFAFKKVVDYVRLYVGEKTPMVSITSDVGTAVVVESPDGEFREIGFVNGIFTKDGGVHCDAVTDPLVKALLPKFNKGKKNGTTLTPKDIKKYFMVFSTVSVVNPEFSSQTKSRMTSPPVPVFTFEPRHIQIISKWGWVEKVEDMIRARDLVSLKKTEKKNRVFRRIEGLDPANLSGGKRSSECTLILCEGLSAKTYATNGINIGWNGRKGRDYFGIFPLRGKPLNTRNATTRSIAENKEIGDVIRALNLRYGVDYSSEDQFSTLYYGSVLIITDADEDGHHICSLLLNMFHHLFPSLLRRHPPFLSLMLTPIAKVFLTKSVETYYTDHEYQERLLTLESSKERFRVKYYKGLGTSSDEEIRETFGQKVMCLGFDETTDDILSRVFDKTRATERKGWLDTYNPSQYRLPPSEMYPISSYINQELIKFSIEDCRRSIPCLYDGLKVSQRKILYACFKRNLTPNGKSLKVAQFAGYCAEHTGYHHGEQCLYDTITRMTHNFVGSNNVPYLARDGQFGSRSYGGKDAANARYVFTKQTPMTRLLFPPEDDELLTYTLDDGERVEPDYYLPIVPTILGNGCTAGIGTGWSCFIPSFDFRILCEKIKTWLSRGEEVDLEEMMPFYEGFRGTIRRIDKYRYETMGVLCAPDKNVEEKKKRKKSASLWEITELPVQVWTNKYKEDLEVLVEEKKIKTLHNYSTPDRVHFAIDPAEGFKPSIETLKLRTQLSTSNMVLLDKDQKPRKFDRITDIFRVYATARLELYTKRRERMLQRLETEICFLKNKSRFLEEVQTQKIRVFRVPEEEILQQLRTSKYDPYRKVSMGGGEEKEGSYDYLLRIPVRDFTSEKIQELREKQKSLEEEHTRITHTTNKMLWIRDLDRFLEQHLKMYPRCT